MPSESLSVRLSGINSSSNGIGGGTGCNFIFLFGIKYYCIPTDLPFVFAYSYDLRLRYTLPKSHFLQLGHIAPRGYWNLMGPYEMIIIVRATIMNKMSISVVLNSDK